MAGRGNGSRHRVRAGITALAVVVTVVAGACNDSRSGEAVERGDAGDDGEVTIVTEPTVDSTAAPQVELPPLDADVADEVAGQLQDPALATWLDDALATLPDPDRPCTTTLTPLPDDAVAAVVTLADDVLGELLVNLDGAIGGLALACDSGDTAAASLEADDVVALVAAVQQRLEEIRR